jgi:peptidoglycan/xylan/chitin deacetylase (PgdA/CDA1 family)
MKKGVVTLVAVAMAMGLSALGRPENHDRVVAITIDDVPGVPTGATLGRLQEINRRVLSTLREENVPAIGFVCERRLHVKDERDARVAILRDWLDSGMTLGNHSFSHKDL